MDLISELPNDILHMILLENHLTRKDIARTCVLSKTWRAINYSSPFLSFDERDFLPKPKHPITKLRATDDNILSGDFNFGMVGNGYTIMHPRRQNLLLQQEDPSKKQLCHDLFINYIETRISSLLHHESSLPIHQYHLTIVNFNHGRDSSSIDLWLKHAFERRVSNLILTVFTTLFEEQKEVLYSLPSWLLVSQTLTKLKLANCKLDDAAGNIKLPLLRCIYLTNLDLEDNFSKCLIFGCPLLEVMFLSYCTKLTILEVTSLPRLVNVYIRSCPSLKSLNIQSSKLQYFQYHGCGSGKSSILLSTSDVLKHLVLSTVRVVGTWLHKQIVKCETLILIKASGFEDTKLSSQKLRCLTIRRCNVKKVVEVDCPNLHSLGYFQNSSPFHYVNPSELRRIIFEFSLDHYQQHISLSDKLKEYCENHVIEKFIKQLIIYSEDHEDVIILDGLIYKSKFTVAVLGEVKTLMPKAKLTISSLDVEDLVDHFFTNYMYIPVQAFNIVSTRKSNSNFPQEKHLPCQTLFSLWKKLPSTADPTHFLQICSSLRHAHQHLINFLSKIELPTPPPPVENSFSSATGAVRDDNGNDPMQIGDDEEVEVEENSMRTTVEKVQEKNRDCFIRNKRPKRPLSPSAVAATVEEQRLSDDGFVEKATDFDPHAMKLQTLDMRLQKLEDDNGGLGLAWNKVKKLLHNEWVVRIQRTRRTGNLFADWQANFSLEQDKENDSMLMALSTRGGFFCI
ncbi:hypothetical protein L6164_003795 [Bauhinia variegata]|uniref:Uncharacterized protein n=1 Tax=Bauhinia variegata TaxID=167791 RepID=A0ACB9Q543_BAUVA|nr:hypothetical protein L6164_003795 [Bauhinia variegata]